MELMGAVADAPIEPQQHVGVTPMYRIRFRGFRSRWATASQGTTPRQFVRAHAGMDMAAIQSTSRIFIEYTFSVPFAVVGPEHVLIAGGLYLTGGSTVAHVRPVVDAFVRQRAEQYGYVAPMDVALWRDDGDLAVAVVVPLEGCSFCSCDTSIRRVGMVNTCLDEHGTRGRPILPSAPALTDAPSEFDPPHVERLRLLHAMALCMQRTPHQTAPLAAGLALATSEFRGMVADALASRKFH
jgi:hypothetical protein